MNDTRTRLHLRDQFCDILAAAMKERSQRDQLVDTPNGPEWAWVLFERQTMLAAVNDHRVAAGLPPVDVAAVERVEGQAVGHVDYHAKFALYCAELALDERQSAW